MRLLFASIHSDLDPSSGAALATRETSLDEVLATLELPARRFQAELGLGGSAGVIDLTFKGVRPTLMPTASSSVDRSPDPRESRSSGPRKERER